jgi:hypothetical protein
MVAMVRMENGILSRMESSAGVYSGKSGGESMKRPQKLAVMLVPTPPYEICGLGAANKSTCCKSQIRIAPLVCPLAMNRPQGDQDATWGASWSCRSTHKHFPSLASQMRMVLSSEGEAPNGFLMSATNAPQPHPRHHFLADFHKVLLGHPHSIRRIQLWLASSRCLFLLRSLLCWSLLGHVAILHLPGGQSIQSD